MPPVHSWRKDSAGFRDSCPSGAGSGKKVRTQRQLGLQKSLGLAALHPVLRAPGASGGRKANPGVAAGAQLAYLAEVSWAGGIAPAVFLGCLSVVSRAPALPGSSLLPHA